MQEGVVTMSAIKKIKSIIRFYVKRILGKRGESLVRAHSTYDGQRSELIKKLNIELAVDVGANVGQWALATFGLGFKGKMISIEPDPRAFKILEQERLRNKNSDNWNLVNIAAGDIESSIDFNDWGVDGGSSSILPLTTKGEMFTYHLNKEIPKIKVSVSTLDEIIKAYGNFNNGLLKIDVQGYEMQVLNGAPISLSKFSMIEIEVPIVDIYEGATLLPEMLIWFRERDFELCSIQTERWTGFGAADVDVLFMRRDKYKEFIADRSKD